MNTSFLRFLTPHNIMNIDNELVVKIDLSVNNTELKDSFLQSTASMNQFVQQSIHSQGGEIGVGGYLEQRKLYQMSNHFKLDDGSFRDIHLGVDIWTDAGTEIFIPYDGEVYSSYFHRTFGDYGGTIITKHTINDQIFYLLFGHLSTKSVEVLPEGAKLKYGDLLGWLGDESENVGWPPHLHFQIILDIEGFKNDYVGVCSMKDKSFYEFNCPNPNMILGFNVLK